MLLAWASGGHLESGETAAECLAREVREEACAEIERAVLVGLLMVDHSINPLYAGPYPTKSALAMFAVLLRELRSYVPSNDAHSRQLLELDALPAVHHRWDGVLARHIGRRDATSPRNT